MLSIKDNGKVRVLMLFVYVPRRIERLYGDTEHGGITNREDTIYVSCPEGPLETDIDDPKLFALVPNHGEAKLVPYQEHRKGAWLSFGGNFAGTSDSRFGEMIARITGQPWCRGIAPVFDIV